MKVTATVAAAALLATSALAQQEAAKPISYPEYLAQSLQAESMLGSRDIKPLILGGTEVAVGARTYTSGLRSSSTGSSFCGGSLISPKHVLTAAHCYGSISYVAVGTHYLRGSTDGVRVRVSKQTRHPNYKSSTNSNDFLILELATAVDTTKYKVVTLAKADDSDIVPGNPATVIGWGATSEGGSQSNVLLQVDVGLISNTECAKTLSVDGTMVCAGGLKGIDSCQGDSGGPLVVNKNGTDVLVGVVSWGEGCGRLGYPGVYSRVSTAANWIKSIVPTAKFS